MYRSRTEKMKTLTTRDIIGLGTAAGRDVPVTGDASAIQVVLGNDSRLSGDTPVSLYDAHTILAATADNTPAAVTIGQQTIVGRLAGGNIKALSVSEAKVLLDVDDAESAISGKAATVHTHTESDVTDLVSHISAKAPSASPTFTGTVVLPTSTDTVGAVVLPAGTVLATPVAGTIEFDGTALYITNVSGTRKTIQFVSE